LTWGRGIADLSSLLNILFDLRLPLAGNCFHVEAIRGIHDVLS
jgi:hypothetical protein